MVNKKTVEVVKAIHAGMSISEIVQDLKVLRRTVYNIKMKLEVRGTTERKPGSGRPISIVNGDLVNKIKRRNRTNPAKTIKSIVRDLGVIFLSERL